LPPPEISLVSPSPQVLAAPLKSAMQQPPLALLHKELAAWLWAKG